MHEQNFAILRGLASVAWADGTLKEREKEALEAFYAAYEASDAEKMVLRAYAAEARTLDDIDLQSLSADDRTELFHHAVLVAWSDGDESAPEQQFLTNLADRLKLSAEVRDEVWKNARERARRNLPRLS